MAFLTFYSRFLTVEISMKILVSELVCVSTKWLMIGLMLDIGEGILEEIRQDANPRDCLYKMLSCWLKTADPLPSWERLIEALKAKAVGEEELATQLRQKYCAGNKNHGWVDAEKVTVQFCCLFMNDRK